MQPYQEASEQILRQSDEPGKFLKETAKAGAKIAGIAGGGAILNRVAPFLNKLIPNDLAAKGLSKIDPRFGKFINGAVKEGQSLDDVMDFIRQKVSPEEEKPPRQGTEQQEDENIIQQFSPGLAGLVDKVLKSGRTIEEVEGVARSPEHKLNSTITNMEKTLGMTFYDIIRSVYGGPKRGQAQGQQQQQPQQQEQTANVPAQMQQGQPPQQQNNDLLSAIQAAQQLRQRRSK